VRWNALVKAYMPMVFFLDIFFLEENVVYHAQNLLRIFGIFSDFLRARWCHAVFDA
jgi:hypothetical protein